MASVHDVAAYILQERGEMTTMKLQKLCYYAQGFSLAWDGVPLFQEPIEAWANGPVCYDLFRTHRGQFTLSQKGVLGDPRVLSQSERETVDAVWAAYGHLDGYQLSMLTHKEEPWLQARKGKANGEPSREPISLDAMQEFFDSVVASEN